MTNVGNLGLPLQSAQVIESHALRLLTIFCDLAGDAGKDAHAAVTLVRVEADSDWGKVLAKAGSMLETWYVQDSMAPNPPSAAEYRSLGSALQERFGKLSKRTEDDSLLSLIFVMRLYARLDGDPLLHRLERGQTRIDRQHRRRVDRRLWADHSDALTARLEQLDALDRALRSSPVAKPRREDAAGVRRVVSGGAPGLGKRA